MAEERYCYSAVHDGYKILLSRYLDVGIGSAASIYMMAIIYYPVITLKPASALERYCA